MAPLDNSAPAAPVDEADFQFQGQTGEGVRVTSAYVSEPLSDVYECRLSLVYPSMPAQPSTMLGQPCSFTIHRGEHTRRVCGIVRTVEDEGHDGVQHHLQVTLVPALWTLTQRSNYRIYQDVSALEIVRDVLKDAGIYQGDGGRREDVVASSYPPREYCTQFGESDLEFVMRLLAEEGIAFYFVHEGETETLVLADGGNQAVWHEVPTLDGLEIAVAGQNMSTASVETIFQFQAVHDMKPSGILRRDYNFTSPRATAAMTREHPRGAAPRVLYEYPGEFNLGDYDAGGTHAYRRHDGTRRTQFRFESLATGDLVCHGLSNVIGLQPGSTFTLSGHERSELDQKYLVIAVEHHGQAPEATVGGAGQSGDRYSNNFTAIPISVPYRPAFVSRRRAPGPQTARVMARNGTQDEISVDVHGRVLVEFHWDRPELRNAQQKARNSSCWMRVAQSWAGAHYGALFIPRVGMEVVVSFVDGDPDRPLITGCVYNAEHMPPNTLPDDLTKTTIKTHSTPGGNGFNELTFKDQAGHERIYMHAQLDHEEAVRRDQMVSVGRDEHRHVGNDRSVTVDRNEVVVIKNDQNVAIHHHGITQANDSLTLQVGNSKIEIYPDRIVLTSATIDILGSTKVNIKGGVVDINE